MSADEQDKQQQPTPQAPASSSAAAPAPAKKPRRRKKAQNQSPPTKDMIPLSVNFQPGKLDVICSRGKFAYNSPGNCWFRCMVEEQMDNYANARTKTDKSLVVSILVNRVRHAAPEGGFVKNVGGRWYRVSDRYSREKVGQQFRDLLHMKYKSSTKAKAEKRKRQQEVECIASGLPGDAERSCSSLDEGNSFNSRGDRSIRSATTSSYSTEGNSFNSRSSDRMPGATTSSYSTQETSFNSFNSRDRMAGVQVTTSPYATPQPSPASSAYMTAATFSSDEKMPALRGKMPALELKPPQESLNLPPRSPAKMARKESVSSKTSTVVAAAAKRTGEDEEEDVKKFDEVDVNMELESLGDFEPLPMLGTGNDPPGNMAFTFGGDDLHNSFPNLFNPPDFHQSMPGSHPGSDFAEGSNSARCNSANGSSSNNNQDGSDNGASDPFFTPFHMSI